MKRYCAFCGRRESEVRILFEPDANMIPPDAKKQDAVTICNICVEQLSIQYQIFKQHLAKSTRSKTERQPRLPMPTEIKKALDQYVISQEQAKKIISVAVYNHYKRILHNYTFDDVEIQKSNILLIGPTGSGKTLIAQTLAKILDVPFAITDATPLTQAGYVGEDVENILLQLIQNADWDLKRAERGIIYIDEIDKIARAVDNPSITRDVSGEGVQQALLKILEGTIANVPPQGGRKHPYQEFIRINTTNILFICGGAFNGLDKIVERRLMGKTMGFNAPVRSRQDAESSKILFYVQPQDIIKYGFIPEFVGRLPVIGVFQSLSEDELVDILIKPRNAIVRQYQKYFQMENVKLTVTPEALRAIARKALASGSGARGLRAILEKIMLDIMYELPQRAEEVAEVIINEEVVENLKPPVEIKRGEKKSKQIA
ncbi:MAG: ATP-dependent Clp protease ATP-binding subunit ClpX [Candidatus Sumerlaeia bacterium]|nr:ATP-dependent Clp protease ATP-binding subunit ClpX [Candidatus Sumerlaeia bacterium]